MREATIKLLELAKEGVLSWETIARSCLAYLSEAEVADMARVNELFFEEDEEDEELDAEELYVEDNQLYYL